MRYCAVFKAIVIHFIQMLENGFKTNATMSAILMHSVNFMPMEQGFSESLSLLLKKTV